MDKFWIVLLFLGVFLIGNSIVKRFVIRFMSSAEGQSSVSAISAEKEDPRIFWAEEGFRREPENADFELPEKDFFENERTEFSENFEDEFKNLSEEEIGEVLKKAGLFEKDGEAE